MVFKGVKQLWHKRESLDSKKLMASREEQREEKAKGDHWWSYVWVCAGTLLFHVFINDQERE